MWWPKSSLILSFKPSRDYQRVLVCCYVLLGLGCCQSELTWVERSLIIGCVCVHFFRVCLAAQPMQPIQQLHYLGGRWQAFDGVAWFSVLQVVMLLHLGRWSCLRLQCTQRRLYVVMFRDQVSLLDWRRFMWVVLSRQDDE